MNNGLHILQWNCNSFLNKTLEFKQYLNSLDSLPDLICLQESLIKNKIATFDNYTVLFADTNRGLAFLIRKDISFSSFQTLNLNCEAISVKINTSLGIINVVNVYCSPSFPLSVEDMNTILNLENCIICGDFNAKSVLWGSPFSDLRGRIIEGVLDNCDTVCLNTGSPTRIYNTGVSHIDLSFASPNIACLSNWEVTNFDGGSDHNCISMEIKCLVPYEKLGIPRWIFKKADWDKFSKLCDENFQSIDLDNSDVNELTIKIIEAIHSAAISSIPRSKGVGKRNKGFWNDECQQAVNDRNIAKCNA